MSKAATVPGMDAADMPADELRNVAKAALEGARMVMLDAAAKADTSIG